MKGCITSVVVFSGKDGRRWEKIAFLKQNGEVGTAIFEEGKHGEIQSDLDENALLALPFGSELEFDERGRLINIG